MMFRFGHSTHPNWREALELVHVQLEGQMQLEQFAADPTRPQKLGLVYVTEPFAEHLDSIIDGLKRRTGVQQWVGGVAIGVCSSGVEYYQEPALVVMLMEFPGDTVRVFSGKVPLPKPGTLNGAGRNAMASALVHVDPLTEDIDDLLEDFSLKVSSNQVFGGLVGAAHPKSHVALEPLAGGVSGVVFADGVPLEVRMTQGVQMVGGEHEITGIRGNFIEELDGQPALDVLLSDLGLSTEAIEDNSTEHTTELLAKRFAHGLFVGITDKAHAQSILRKGFAGGKVETHQLKVRPVVGMDPGRKSLAVADDFKIGDHLAFCTRDENSARVDLTRMCAELREDLDAPAPRLNELQAAGFSGIIAQRKPRGALYIACNGRGAALFGQQGVEQQIVREQLGDIPLVGFSANGEIFKGALYGYTGVLALFF
ncbi:MAG TPA: FIST N-terminal domain-containing protein [Limnobacter sp.]|uniref:FIST signal transduction protein n=1 Tax=Limnobacter sp. TaxID=2003368 RepID=UPI002ED7FC12